MLAFLRDCGASDRKLQLLACSWCREVWYQLANGACRAAVEMAERAADDASAGEEVNRAWEAARATSTDARGVCYAGRKGAGFDAALYTALSRMWHIDKVLESTQLLAARPAFRVTQCRLARCIFGNPLH